MWSGGTLLRASAWWDWRARRRQRQPRPWRGTAATRRSPTARPATTRGSRASCSASRRRGSARPRAGLGWCPTTRCSSRSRCCEGCSGPTCPSRPCGFEARGSPPRSVRRGRVTRAHRSRRDTRRPRCCVRPRSRRSPCRHMTPSSPTTSAASSSALPRSSARSVGWRRCGSPSSAACRTAPPPRSRSHERSASARARWPVASARRTRRSDRCSRRSAATARNACSPTLASRRPRSRSCWGTETRPRSIARSAGGSEHPGGVSRRYSGLSAQSSNAHGCTSCAVIVPRNATSARS